MDKWSETQIALEERKIAFIEKSMALLKTLHGDDKQSNARFAGLVKKITFFPETGDSLNPISVVCDQLGYKTLSNNQLVDIHKLVAAKYKEKYNKDPPQQRYVSKGRVVWTEAYSDVELVIQAYHEVVQPAYGQRDATTRSA